MSLRSKIILAGCITLCLASIMGNACILYMVHKGYVKEAESQALQDANTSFYQVSRSENVKTEYSDIKMQYYMKSQKDPYMVCVRYIKVWNEEKKESVISLKDSYEIYNNTVFSLEYLADKEFEENKEYIDGNALECTSIRWNNRHLIIYKHNIDNERYTLYKVVDITAAWDKTRTMALYMAIVTLLMLIIISIVIYIITSKIMYPLQELNDSTKSIAEGKYDRRVEIYSHDEVGQLSENFNKMVDAIEVKTNSLVESERKKTLFMGNLTHELKTPLTAISGYAQTLLSVKLSEEDREEALSYIYEESCRLERLSRKMMNILFLEEEAPLELAPVTAAELFERVAVSCSGVLEDKHITLVCREAGEIFMVDSDLMTEVLINLVDNGIKASQEGSQIILTAGENMISVQDFGKGIPEEEQDKILEPFYMIDKSRSRKKGGAGLGLAITASILKKHNCTLEIDSRLGEGTCMKITICL